MIINFQWNIVNVSAVIEWQKKKSLAFKSSATTLPL